MSDNDESLSETSFGSAGTHGAEASYTTETSTPTPASPWVATASAEAPAAPIAAPAPVIPQQPTYEAPAPVYPAPTPAPGPAYPAPFPPAVPATPEYAPGYAAPVSAPAGYPAPVSAPAGYAAPAGYPAGYPAPAVAYGAPVAAPVKRKKTGIIIMSILTVIFLLTTVGMAGLFVSAANKLDTEKKTTASQAAQIATLTKDVADTKAQLSTLQTSTTGQIDDLKKASAVSKTCVNDIDAFMNLPARSTNATLDKAWNKMVKACIVAKAAID